jgi:large subunit ribosomal protein L3
VKGAVPGTEGTFVKVRDAIKGALPADAPKPAGLKKADAAPAPAAEPEVDAAPAAETPAEGAE